jgi:hypothetical protein
MDDASATTSTEPRPPDYAFSPEDGVESLLVKAYQGEVSGEVLFGTIAEHTQDPERRRKFEVLTQLEIRTRQACLPAMGRYGLPTEPDPDTLSNAKVMAEVAAAMAWEDLLSSFAPITSQFVVLYKRIGEISAEDREISKLLVDHEHALLTFAERELRGETENSLEPILSLPHMA